MSQSSVFQQKLFPEDVKSKKINTDSTFADNLALPIHRWFRYSAGFSALWVRELIKQEKAKGRYNILDPFAGSGTTLLEGEYCGVNVVGIESHPFVARIARAKLCWRENPQSFCDYASSILEHAKNLGR
jgi:DNA modification methylase